MITSRFESLSRPGPEVTMDEAMVSFEGRLSFLQYLKDKPTKWGIKIWVLRDARAGIVYRMLVYSGKDEVAEKGQSNRVVLTLLKGLENQGIKVYTDNFYTSADLLCHLHDQKIYGCGNARVSRRGLPKYWTKVCWMVFCMLIHPLSTYGLTTGQYTFCLLSIVCI
jgi:hypothetical protein